MSDDLQRSSQHSPPARSRRTQTAGSTSSPSDEEAGERLDLSRILSTLFREKWLVLLTGIVVAGAVGGYTYTQPPVYRASSMVKIAPQQSGAAMNAGMGGGGSGGSSEGPSLEGEIGVLQNSLDLARRVAKQLKARDDADGTGRTFPILAAGTAGASAGVSDVARRIMEAVEFAAHPRRDMIEIVVESPHPEQAATLANIYAAQYKKRSQEKARASLEAARDFLKNQVEQQREKIDRLESQWQSFVQNNQVVQEGQAGEHLQSKYAELNARRDQLSFELKKKRTQLELLREQLNQFQPELRETVMQKQAASGLESEIKALEEKIGQLRAEAANYYAANPDLEGDTTRIQNDFPDLARLLERIDALTDRKQKLTENLVDQVSGESSTTQVEGNPIDRVAQLRSQIAQKRLDRNQLESQLAAVDAQIGRLEGRLDRIPAQRVERKQLQRKLDQAVAFHETITGKLQRAEMAVEAELGYVETVKSAFVPSAPVRPNVTKNTVLGIVLGLAFGIGLAFFKEATDSRIRAPRDVEERGFNLLGMVPDMGPEIQRTFEGRRTINVEGSEISTRLIPLLNPWSPITENYRLIRTHLEPSTKEVDPLLVTSGEQGDGKTVLAVNLALTEVLAGRRVLLIDADMRRPTAHALLDLPRSPGLAGVLDSMQEDLAHTDRRDAETPTLHGGDGQTASWPQCWRTAVEDLYFIPAGTPERAPTELLDSARIDHLVQATEHRFDRIIIDTPPTRAATDAVVIGSQTGARSIVVAAADRDARSLESASRTLTSAGVAIAGVVLNRVDRRRITRGSYSYSYYDRDDGYDDHPEPAPQEVDVISS